VIPSSSSAFLIGDPNNETKELLQETRRRTKKVLIFAAFIPLQQHPENDMYIIIFKRSNYLKRE
jgi:hypothetical protein